jgi:predicted AlkP superfamily pyrophosphatase or phosphodiesterase
MTKFFKIIKLTVSVLMLSSCSDNEVQDVLDSISGINNDFVTASNTTGSTTRKVLLIGIDGLRVGDLAKVSTPNIDKLISQGTANMNARLTKYSPTMSAPGWASIFTGVWPNKHKVMGNSEDNLVNSQINAYQDIFSAIETRDEDIETFAAYKWSQFTYMIRNPNVLTLEGANVVVREIVRGQHEDDDKKIMSYSSSYLKNKQADAVLVYFEGLDQKGHAEGLGGSYLSYITQLDKYVGELLSLIEKRKTYANEHWLICLATDHGMREVNGKATHGGFSAEEMRTLYVVKDNRGFVEAGKKIGNGSNVDFFPTMWYHMFGEARSDLDGRVVGYRH